MLSFPKPGISIALDIPMQAEKTQAITDALNEVVIGAGESGKSEKNKFAC